MAGLIPLALDLDLDLEPELGGFQVHDHHAPLHQSLTAPWMEWEQSATTMKRVPTKSLAHLHAVPSTMAEWKRVLAEVKREYTSRRFRQCSSRCQEILDNIRSCDVIERAYAIFLHFYTASSLEMQVRSLHNASPHRSKLLLRARDNYRQASDLARDEDTDIASRPPPPPLSPSILRSPTGSVSSRSTVSTRTSSPSPSLTDRAADTPKPKKRVKFCDPPVSEPIIRPDSPTLGFDEWLGRSSPDLVIASDPGLLQHVNEDPPALSLSLEEIPQQEEQDHQPEAGSFWHARSIQRYSSILAGIRHQIATHLASVEADVAAAENPAPPPPRDEQMRAMELRARIERLRAEGWPRRKFDAQRYEALRESAVADMMG